MAHRKLRVLHVIEAYDPQEGGGAAIYTRDLCRMLATRGHEVRVLTAHRGFGELYGFVISDDFGVKIHRMNLPASVADDPEGWSLSWRESKAHRAATRLATARFLRGWSPDVVHYDGAPSFGEGALAALQAARIPTFGLFHDAGLVCLRVHLLQSPQRRVCSGPFLPKCTLCAYSNYDGWVAAILKLPWRAWKLGPGPLLRYAARRSMLRRMRSAVCPSNFIAAHHDRFLPQPVVRMQLGVERRESEPRVSPPQDVLKFGYVGGFHRHKGLELILAAVETLRDGPLRFEVHVWGDADRNPALAARARQNSPDVVLHPPYRPQDAPEALASVNVLIIASTVCETLPRVLHEAAAVGLPAIAPAAGGIPEVVRHDIDGLLFAFGDHLDLSRKMERLLAEPGLWARLAAGVRPPPSFLEAVRELELLYDDAMRAPAAHTPAP